MLQKRTTVHEGKLIHDDQNSSEWEGKHSVQRPCHGEGKDDGQLQQRCGRREFSPSVQFSNLLSLIEGDQVKISGGFDTVGSCKKMLFTKRDVTVKTIYIKDMQCCYPIMSLS